MHAAADLTGQANHLGVTIQADIIKQKLPERNGGYNLLNVESSYGKTSKKIYEELTSDNPIDLVVGAEFPVPRAFWIVVVMNVVETVVEDESGQHARGEARNVARLQPVGKDVPDAHVDARV